MNNNQRENAKPKPRGRSLNKWLLCALVLLALGAVIGYEFYRGAASDEGGYFTLAYEPGDKADFYINDSNIFYCNKQGVSLLDGKGKPKWSDSFNTLSPVLCGDKNTLAVLEKTGTTAAVYNERGLLYKAEMNFNPLTYAVNGQGCFGAVIKEKNNYKLNFYNSSGNMETIGEFSPDKGVPMAIDISEDGRIIAVGFIDISGIELTGSVSFYYTNAKEANSTAESDGLFCTIVSPGSMPVMLRFNNDNRCFALMDGGLIFIEPENPDEAKKKQEITFGNRVNYACLNGDGTLALALGDSVLNAASSVAGNTVLWYDGKGNKVNEVSVAKTITGLYPGKNITVVAQDRTFEAVSTKGNSLWSYNAVGDTYKVLPYEGSGKMLTVSASKAMLSKAGKGEVQVQTTEASTSVDENTQGGAGTQGEAATQPVTPGEGTTAPGEEPATEETTKGAETDPEAQEAPENEG